MDEAGRPSLDELPRGYRFPPVTYTLDPDWVAEYLSAVEDAATPALGAGLVPGMALATLAVRALLEQVRLPPGAVHLSQEVQLQRAVQAGERVTAEASIVSRGERQGWLLLTIEMAARDARGEPVMTGRATLGMPVEGATP